MVTTNRPRQARKSRRGSALVTSIVVMVGVLGLTGAVLGTTLRTKSEWSAAEGRNKALHMANSGISHAFANLLVGEENDLGSYEDPVDFSEGSYWVTVVDNEDGTYTLTSTGVVHGESQSIEAVVGHQEGGVFNHALFAGNSSDDPLYSLDLGGVGAQGDEILGDIYSGGDLVLEDDAMATGTLRAKGTITGGSGETNVNQPIPDLQAMDYENTADFDVLQLFLDDNYSYSYDSAGGYAYQVPEDNPAHIFRINPSDRQSEYQSTAKLDFFLEDPYESVTSDLLQDGSNAYRVSFTGGGNEPGPYGSQKVYYIDGNLWIHNKKTYSLKYYFPESEGLQVTFVVKGNIYFGDNLFYHDEEDDGVAFIALEDENVSDSGNIYFGDPEFGTLEKMNGYMYAENNFYDINLDATGSSVVEVNGIMSAGNQVDIQRDFGSQHTKLKIDFDDRVFMGTLELPGLPTFEQEEESWDVVAWRTVPLP